MPAGGGPAAAGKEGGSPRRGWGAAGAEGGGRCARGPARLTGRVAVSPQMWAEVLLLPRRAGLRLLPPLRLRHRAPAAMKLQSPQFQALFTPGLRSVAGECGAGGSWAWPPAGRPPQRPRLLWPEGGRKMPAGGARAASAGFATRLPSRPPSPHQAKGEGLRWVPRGGCRVLGGGCFPSALAALKWLKGCVGAWCSSAVMACLLLLKKFGFRGFARSGKPGTFPLLATNR